MVPLVFPVFALSVHFQERAGLRMVAVAKWNTIIVDSRAWKTLQCEVSNYICQES